MQLVVQTHTFLSTARHLPIVQMLHEYFFSFNSFRVLTYLLSIADGLIGIAQ